MVTTFDIKAIELYSHPDFSLAIGSCLPGLDTSIVYTAMSRIGTDFERLVY